MMRPQTVSILAYLLIIAGALALAGLVITVVLLFWSRRQAPHYWEE